MAQVWVCGCEQVRVLPRHSRPRNPGLVTWESQRGPRGEVGEPPPQRACRRPPPTAVLHLSLLFEQRPSSLHGEGQLGFVGNGWLQDVP